MFSLSGRKVLLRSGNMYEVVLVDVTESLVECLKRGKNVAARARKSGTP